MVRSTRSGTRGTNDTKTEKKSAYFEINKTAGTTHTKKQPRTKVANRKSNVDEADFEEEEEEEDVKVYESDALDDDSEFEQEGKKETTTKRRRVAATKSKSPRKKLRRATEDEEEEEKFDGLKEGQQIVGVVVEAPKTGRVPPGQVSQNTFDFLAKLKDPKYNDREWFKLHEPVYRVAEKEWKDFVETFTDLLIEVDSQVPHLPPKDVIHRIYRDIRFSNDKTPYKKGLSASFSRSGRKGIFAGYHIAIQPGNESLIAAGSWCPGKNELATIRSNIQRNPRRPREAIAAPKFVEHFGKPKPHPKGERQNIPGMEGELKTAPKGIDKDHKDIDLLKCRSFAVVHRFTDSEVLDPDFKENLVSVAKVMQPLVHCLNDMMTIVGDDGDSDEGEDEDSGEVDEDEEE